MQDNIEWHNISKARKFKSSRIDEEYLRDEGVREARARLNVGEREVWSTLKAEPAAVSPQPHHTIRKAL